MIPVDNVILVVESWKDIVKRFNGDPYRGMLRSVPSHFGYKRSKCWTLENVSFPVVTTAGGCDRERLRPTFPAEEVVYSNKIEAAILHNIIEWRKTLFTHYIT